VLLVVSCLATPALADAYRQQIEAEWQRHDESRVMQIRQAGLVRFPEGEVPWPGVPSADGAAPGQSLRVPKVTAPVVDGRLEEPAWQQAAKVPLGPPDQPVRPAISLLCDEKHLLVGATFPTACEPCFFPASTAADASGAVDGVKNGRYAFHTNLEPNPWWQVDLGSPQAIGKIVVYNRLDYPPGLHNADILVILTSDDGKTWTQRYDNAGKAFGGITDGKPLVVDFSGPNAPGGPGKLEARFVRIQLPSTAPIFLHLDEVEVYGPGGAGKNLALGRPADQSSRSPWSRGGPLVSLGKAELGLAAAGGSMVITLSGNPLPAELARLSRSGGQTQLEATVPIARLPGGFPADVTPFHSQPTRLAGGSRWSIQWPENPKVGFGANRLELRVQAERAGAGSFDLSVETVVFTPMRPERAAVVERRNLSPGPVTLEFPIAHEGAAAVILTLREGGAEHREGRAFFVAPVAETLARLEKVSGAFSHQRRLTPLLEEAAELRSRLDTLSAREKAVGTDPDARMALYRQARWLARRVAFANPKLQFDKLLFVKRFTQQTYPDVCLNHMPWVSRPGGDICILTLAGPEKEGQVGALLNGALGPGHVHGADLWYDADRVVFGYAKAKSSEPPKGWLNRATSFVLRKSEQPIHLFEIGIDGKGLRQLTTGEWSDLDPTYLPSGEIAFVSERCGYSLQCNEYDKDETSTNLYVMRPDGTNIRRLTVTKDGDYLPHTLDDGTIGYTRWEYQERGWANIQSLWFVRPDGTGADALFKQHFNDPWAVEECRSIPGTNALVGVAAGHHTLPAGPVILITPRQGINNPRGIRIVTPGVMPPEGGMTGTAVPEGGVLGTTGYYTHPWPISETTFLVSYGAYGHGYGLTTQEIDPTGYALYLIDVYGTKELIYRDPAISSFLPIPLRPRPKPPILPDVTDPTIPYALCSLQNAAKGAPGIDPTRVKYLRIGHGIAWPYCNTYGGQRYEPDVKSVMINWNPVQVIGEVPVEADGSAQFRVPTDTPLYFQLLDENHMELRRMRSFINFQPGEVRGCVGCHETREEAGAVALAGMAQAREASIPVPPPWGHRPTSFLRDIQPLFDKHCTGCHAGLKPAAGLDFSGGLTARYNRCYDTILANKLIAQSNVGEDARITMPLAFGSHQSRLVAVLRDGPCSKRARLSQEDWLRLVTWIDANGPYHDGFINKRPPRMPYDLPNDRELGEKIAAVHERRCAGCHQPAEVSRLDWIALGQPRDSLFLVAPMAQPASPRSRCTGGVYKDPADPDYRALVELVESAVKRAWELPRRDLKALLPTVQLGSR
jgi:hypothetical protein